MLLSAVTGGFYAYHLDNVELEQRPSRLYELGLQGAAIAICWLSVDASSFAILLGDASLALDKILMTAVVGAIAGAALAWYIPQAAASTKFDPLSVAREELAERCGMHLNSISAMEKRGAESLTSGLDTINKVVRVLESLGIEFTNGEAIGVRLRPKPSKGKK